MSEVLFFPERYKKNRVGKGGSATEFYFSDGSDTLGNKRFIITITHVPSGKIINFKAFITAFNDSYSQDWNSQPVYGRIDPLYNFKQTTRKISIGFKMPAASESEAYENLTKAQSFSQFLYPNYTDAGAAKIISQGPLLRLQVMNLLQTPTSTDQQGLKNGESLYTSYKSGDKGVLGFCNDVTFNFNLENHEQGVFQKSDGTILPKLIEVSIGGFSPIHEQGLGWEKDIFGKLYGDSDGSNFPYGAQKTDSQDPESSLKAGHQFAVLARKHKQKEGASFSLTEQEKLEKAKAEAAIANAEARYGGLAGDLRRRRDDRKMKNNKYSESKAAYVRSAQEGYDAELLREHEEHRGELNLYVDSAEAIQIAPSQK